MVNIENIIELMNGFIQTARLAFDLPGCFTHWPSDIAYQQGFCGANRYDFVFFNNMNNPRSLVYLFFGG